jgi:dienelactone hydrolase
VNASPQREPVRFTSGDTYCAAWHYPGANGACVVMAGGFGVTKEPATDAFARRFHEAGFSVLAFDYRRLGESGGEPRQVLRIRQQLADWQAAVEFAPTLRGVDPDRIAIWGFSASGGHILRVAARNPRLAAAIAQTPLVDGQAASRTAIPHTTPGAMLRLTGLAARDALRGLAGRDPLLVPLAGERGTVAALTTPDSLDWAKALAAHRYPDWRPEIAARSALRPAFYRPVRYAARIRCPLLVVVCDGDQSTPADAALKAAARVPDAEVVHLPGSHYAPFMDAHEDAVGAELAFLRSRLLETAGGQAERAAS